MTMHAPISDIIPTFNSQTAITELLHCLFGMLVSGLIHEVVVVDAGSKSATVQIALDVGCKILYGTSEAK